MRVPFFDLPAGNAEVRGEIEAAVRRVLDSGWFVLGAEVAAFEAEWAEYVGARHCIGLGNGLDALHLGLRALGVGAGDEVIVPSHTYIATWLAVSYAGAVPVPVEPDPETYLVSAGALDAAVTERTKAVLPVHLYGRPADLTEIGAAAARHGLRVLDDAAQAHGATWGGRRVGALSDLTAWSFYPSKNLGALGDGGAVTTDDDGLADRVRLLRNYGSDRKYVHQVPGYNSRLDELQAAVLRAKLPHLAAWNERRRLVAERYGAELKGLDLVLPEVVDGHVWHVYVVRSSRRDALAAHLAERGVETVVHYPIPPHRQGAYAALGLAAGSLPVAEAVHDEVLSLPMGPHLTEAQQSYVIDAVRSFA